MTEKEKIAHLFGVITFDIKDLETQIAKLSAYDTRDMEEDALVLKKLRDELRGCYEINEDELIDGFISQGDEVVEANRAFLKLLSDNQENIQWLFNSVLKPNLKRLEAVVLTHSSREK